MASISSNDILKQARIRKQKDYKAVEIAMSVSIRQENEALSKLSIMRAEKGTQEMKVANALNVIEAIGMPAGAYFFPYLEYQSVEPLQLYEALARYASYAREDESYCQRGIELLRKMKGHNYFSKDINVQKLISQEVVLQEALKKDPAEIRRFVKDGLRITCPELAKDPFAGDMLIFEEAPLLHSLARTYMLEGDTSYAAKMLGSILARLINLPQDDKDKERMIAPILLTLAQCYMHDKNYDEVLSTCDIGRKIALKRNNGFYVPDFAEQKIYCHHMMGIHNQLPVLMPQVYVGYALLRRYNKADSLQQYAIERDMAFNTYGMEAIRPPMPQPVFAYGKAVKCGSIGQLLAKLREAAGMTQEQLCDGLCTKGTLSKIENTPYPLDHGKRTKSSRD